MVCVSTDMEHAINMCFIIFFSLLDAMEAILEEECLREKRLREYEEGRAEVTRTLLSQLVLFNDLLLLLLSLSSLSSLSLSSV
jgi:hypothetical protein